MENWSLEILDSLVDIDSEQLSNMSEKDYSFYYIDIGSVSSGMITFPSFPITFKEAPSRARKIIQNGDILMSSVRPNLKAFARFNSTNTKANFVASTGFAVLRSKKGTDIDYIYHSLFSSSIESQITSLVTGSNYPALNSTDIRKLKIHLPQSKTEQNKIASILNLTDEVIAQTKKLISKYQSIKLGLQQDLLTKGIDVTGNIRSRLTHKFVIKKGIEVPEDWHVNSLSHYSNLHNNLRRPISALERFNKKGIYPYYGATGIIDLLNEYRVEGKYVLIGEDGDHFLKFEKQEMTHLVDGKFNVSNHAHILSGKNGCQTEWIHYFFSHRDITFHLTRQGAGRFKLNKQALNNLPICIPSPEEQIRIIDFIETFNTQYNIETANLEKYQLLKTGLMQDLLTGKVRV